MMYSKYFLVANKEVFAVRSGTIVGVRGRPVRFGRAAVTSLPFTDAVRPMYWTLSAAFDGATAEPPPHAEHIASATRTAVYFTKPDAFMTLPFLSRDDRRLFLDRADRQVEA